MDDPEVPAGRKKPAPGEATVVTAVTEAFSGHNTPSAVAQCPAGYTCSGGRVDGPDAGMIIIQSRVTEDGTAWYGAFSGGPSGAVAVVSARCVPVAEESSPSEP